jgi:hypothetical protein
MDIIGLKKIRSLDEAWEIAVPSRKTVDCNRSGGSPIGVSPPKLKKPIVDGLF